jgi:hypothetical protein
MEKEVSRIDNVSDTVVQDGVGVNDLSIVNPARTVRQHGECQLLAYTPVSDISHLYYTP